MSKRLLTFLAIALAIVVFAVLVLPQVDLEDGTLRDMQWKALLLVLLAYIVSFARSVPLILEPAPVWRYAAKTSPPPGSSAASLVSLRC